MATQKRKTTSQGRRQTTKKSSSGKRGNGRNHKESSGPDLLTIVIVLVAIVLVVVLLKNYNKEKEAGNTPALTGTVTGTVTPGVSPEAAEPSVGPTSEPSVTKPSVTKQPSAAPTPTEEPMLSLEEAKRIIEEKVELEVFSVELLDDHTMIEGAEYYTFCVNDENGEAIEPLLIVEKREGELFCYDITGTAGVVSPFTKFPLDKTETGSSGIETITEEEAKAVLAGYSKEKLGLAKEVSSYEMEADAWTTTAEGKDCYGINLFEETEGKKRLRGTFYVALDGSAVYSREEITGEFIKR